MENTATLYYEFLPTDGQNMKVDLDKTALLIVDMQHQFISRAGLRGDGCGSVFPDGEYEAVRVINAGKQNALFPLRGNAGAGTAEVAFAEDDGVDHAADVKVHEFQLVTVFLTEAGGKFHLVTDVFAVLQVTPRLADGGTAGPGECTVFTGELNIDGRAAGIKPHPLLI